MDQLRLSLEEQYYAERPATSDSSADDDDGLEEASSSAATTTSSSLPSSFSKAFWVRMVLLCAGPRSRGTLAHVELGTDCKALQAVADSCVCEQGGHIVRCSCWQRPLSSP